MNRDQHLKSKKIELVLQQLNSLPTLPAVAARLLQLTVANDTQAQEVVRLIESDPSLASKIIAMATNASTGIGRQTVTLSKAVVLLGFDAVRNAVLSIKVFEALGKENDQNVDFDKIGFWKHSLAVACAAKLIAELEEKNIDPEEAFLCGLLHDIGKLALVTCLPRSYNRVIELTESTLGNIAETENVVLGIDHTIAGKRLAEKWQMPDAIIENIWLHHQWVKGLPDVIKNKRIIQIVHLADIIAREQHIGYSGNHVIQDSSMQVARDLGFRDQTVKTIIQKLHEEIGRRATILGLDEIDPEELYREALSDANSELSRLNSRLQNQNNRLKVRSDYLDLLNRLAGSLNAGQTVATVCETIASHWRNQQQCQGCAVYLTDFNSEIIEGIFYSGSDNQSTSFIVDLTEDPTSDLNEAGGNPFVPSHVNETHYWFFEQVAPTFNMGSTIAIPLNIGPQLKGGILWESPESLEYYKDQAAEIRAFASCVSLLLNQAHILQNQSRLCEQLTRGNELLQRAQKELLRKRNLAAAGEMAAGAAHEINNPLAVIVGRSEWLAKDETDLKRKETLEKIAQQGKLITDIITELMAFAKPTLPQQKVSNIEQIVTDAVQQLEKHPDTTAEIQANFEEFLPEVFTDSEQISLAITELLLNAIQSYRAQQVPEITISAACNDVTQEVCIEIADQGCGMDDQTLKKAFDPFFSAKQAGRRRGMGLSRALRLIESNGGSLRLISQPNQGTIATITLPFSQNNNVVGVTTDPLSGSSFN